MNRFSHTGLNGRIGQQGFTIVELVVVIVLLGILAAVALPRFISVTDDAHEAAVAGAGGALASGVGLFRAQWVANGGVTGTNQNNVAGFGDSTVDGTTTGYPASSTDQASAVLADTITAAECVEIWQGVLQGGAPGVATAAGTGIDYVATVASPTCTYTYQGTANMSITYNASTGAVAIDDDSSS